MKFTPWDARKDTTILFKEFIMIKKLKSGGYRLYARKRNPKTGKRRNLGTFSTLRGAKRHERAVQFFKNRG